MVFFTHPPPPILLGLRHLIISRAVTIRIFFAEKTFYPFMRAQHVLSYHLVYVPWLKLSTMKHIAFPCKFFRSLHSRWFKVFGSFSMIFFCSLTLQLKIFIAFHLFYKVAVLIRSVRPCFLFKY